MDAPTMDVKTLMGQIKVLIVDDEHFTRKVIHTLLLSIGCVRIHEAHDGASGLEAIRDLAPDVVLLDWEMPGMDGAAFVRAVRSPGAFPYPHVPIVMLTGYGERWRVLEAVRLGVHEFLLKPVSRGALLARLVSVIRRPRPMVRRGDYRGPERRKLSSCKPEAESDGPKAVADAPATVAGDPAVRAGVDRSPRDVIFVD